MPRKPFKNRYKYDPIYFYSTKRGRSKFMSSSGKEKTVSNWANWKRTVSHRYPWLNQGDNLDWYMAKKHLKHNNPGMKTGNRAWKPVPKYEKWKMYDRNNFMHKKMKCDRRNMIKKNMLLARKRKAQLKKWRKGGSVGPKPKYPKKL